VGDVRRAKLRAVRRAEGKRGPHHGKTGAEKGSGLPGSAVGHAPRESRIDHGRTITRPLPSIQGAPGAPYVPAGCFTPTTVSAFTVNVPLPPSGASVLILLWTVIVRLAARSLQPLRCR